MNRLRLFFCLICLVMFGQVWSATVSESQALEIANRFVAGHTRAMGSLRLTHAAPAVKMSQEASYYVFNSSVAGGGFVIVAGDDRVPAVLGYSDSGALDMSDMPEAMQHLLESYAEQIAALDEGAVVAAHVSARPVAPLLKCEWSQNKPYNTMLPVLSSGDNAHVGCVATAMAQVMYYWQWPNRSLRTIPAYVSKTLSINMPALSPVSFNWSSMKDTYRTDETQTQAARAVAQLSLYCAQSVKMDFKDNSSSAFASDIPLAMYTYFDYSPRAKYLQRRYFTTQEWEQMVIDELVARRPVIYRGEKASGGHAFVCDGYEGNGMFHINWGWNGNSNGYFLLSVLNPDAQGTGGASGSYGYVSSQGMITGLEPHSAGSHDLDVYDRYIEIQSSTNTRSSVSQNFTVTQVTHFLNTAEVTIGFNYAWGLYQGDNLLKVMESGVMESLESWYYIHPTRTLAFGSGISSGTYRIKPIYCELNKSNWRPCIGAGVNYIEVTINGNYCTMTCHGEANSPKYQVNSISTEGNLHVNRPVYVTLDVTNLGLTRNDIIYMFVNGKLASMGYVDLETNARGLVPLVYVPDQSGYQTLKFTYDEKGTQVITTRGVSISVAPAANLSGSTRMLNVTDSYNHIVTANEFVVELTVSNNGTTTYDEDITMRLYKHIYGNTGSLVQTSNQHVVIGPGQRKTLTFHMNNVMDGWKYFAKSYYYSGSDQVSLADVSFYTIVFPQSQPLKGDVNHDGEVNIADVNLVISIILNGGNNAACDVNGDGEINLADVNTVIDIILGGK